MDTVTPKERSRIMSLIRSKDTKPELVVRRLVHSLGYRFRLHVTTLPGTPDLVFASRRKVILVSGCFWHGHSCGRCRIPTSRRAYWISKIERNRLRDRRTHRQLKRLGWDLLVVWECEIKQPERLADTVQQFLSQSRWHL